MASLFLCNLMYVFLAPFYFVGGRKINIELSHFPQFILKEAEQGVNFLDSTCFSCKVNVSFFSAKAFVMIHQSIYHTSIKSDGAKPSWVNTKCVYHIPQVYEKYKRLFLYIHSYAFLSDTGALTEFILPQCNLEDNQMVNVLSSNNICSLCLRLGWKSMK